MPDEAPTTAGSAPERRRSLEGRVAIVAGTSGSLGRIVARDLAAAEARLVLVGRRRGPPAELAESMIHGAGASADHRPAPTAHPTTAAGAPATPPPAPP